MLKLFVLQCGMEVVHTMDSLQSGDRAPTDDPSATSPTAKRGTLAPLGRTAGSLRERLSLKDELVLAIAPTAAILCVLWMIELLSQHKVLFASLASSAFLIYLDPNHKANSPRSIALSQVIGALVGVATDYFLGVGYLAAGVAMVVTIVLLIAVDAVHPPAIGTALSFAFRRSDDSALGLFLLALVVILILVILQRLMLSTLTRLTRKNESPTPTVVK